MASRAMMVTGSISGTGGIQHVNRAVHAVLRQLGYQLRCRTIRDESRPSTSRVTARRRLLFLARLQADRLWRPQLVFFDHARIAFRSGWLWGASGRRVVFAHGVEVWQQRFWHVAVTLAHADLVLCNSNYTRDKLLSLYGTDPSRLMVVHLGSDLPDPPDHQSTSRSGFVVAGRMSAAERYKGHDELLHAWPGVLSHHPGEELRVVGDGDDRPRLQRLAQRLGVEKAVRFVGPVSDEEKARQLRSARALLMLSTGEGFGLVTVEAMAAGTPVVGLAGTVTQEIISDGENGLLVPDRGAASLLQAIRRLIDEPGLADQLGAAARHDWEHRFTGARFHARLLAAFSAVRR